MKSRLKKSNISIKKRKWRKQNLPRFSYNPSLPITDRKDDIITAISNNQVVIISGETGSGKTTQIPKFCLAAQRGITGKIGCTQPRRIAAVTVAHRVAAELGEKIGRSVGYKIRFKDKTRHDSYIKIMTDGILLAETLSDPDLNEYDTIIVDEAHERSLNIDFVLGILKKLVKKRRKDLKLIITSATIDTEKFSKAFDAAPVIEVSGRMFPVDVRYLPTDLELKKQKSEEKNDLTHVEMAADAVDTINKEGPYGDILVFMPTEQDIRETCELLEGRNYNNAFIYPLFARLPASEQSRIFSRPPGRKIVVATNVAETSITIPGIKYVVDTGLARISQYSPRSRTTALPVMSISRSSADQRKGRCGRVENGICIRLYSEKDFLSRPLFTLPEILRSNLAQVILRMIALNLGDISDFPFIDRPAKKSIKDGFDLLLELGAISKEHGRGYKKGTHRFNLTEKGTLMSKIPIDPRLSRMLLEAQLEGCLKEVTVIASVLSIQDPRERPTEKAREADEAHLQFTDPASDFIAFLNIWETYHRTWRQVKSANRMKKYCRDHYLSFKRMREWRDIHSQISAILEENRLKGKDKKNVLPPEQNKHGKDRQEIFTPFYNAVHKSILSGFLSNIALKKEKNFFQAAKGKEVMIFPGSGLFNRSKTWIVAAEMVETSRLFARTVANIDNSWLEVLGGDQCKYTYLSPHWERNRGEVVAFEQVSLFGLILEPGRPVSYGKVNREEAAEIFIRSALVEGDMRRSFDFMKHNQRLIDEIKDMENRLRRRDMLVGDQEIIEFYQERLSGIYDMRTLRKRLKKKGGDNFLQMSREDLFLYSPDENELSHFPNCIDMGNNSFECLYQFNPGKADDGVTVKIPSSIAPVVSPETVDWLVPGLYQEKITALIKGLPKTYRKQLVPVTDTVDTVIRHMPKSNHSLITALGQFIYEHFGVDIPAAAWDEDVLPDHLKMRISITGTNGEELVCSREKTILCQNFAGSIRPDELGTAGQKWEKTGITRWDFGDLPEKIEVKIKNKGTWTAHPGLEIDSKTARSVNLRLFYDHDKAIKLHKEGVAGLYAIYFAKDLKFLKKNLVIPPEAVHYADYFGGARRFVKRLYARVTKQLFQKNLRTEKAFYSHAEAVKPVIISAGRKLLESAIPVLEAYYNTRSSIYRLERGDRIHQEVLSFLGDLKEELARLVPQNFLDLYDAKRFVHLARYIKAVEIRAQRAVMNFEKQKAKAKELKVVTDSLNDLLKGLSPLVSKEKKKAVEEYFWLIEEYKVSLFAQELKTAIPVSQKRLEKKLSEIERMV
ncbi:MAG: ATP-dependent RNA helicase HrpA [Thermodesulfobacteriota bacterium]|nr:ATP-dependent RNA helicase HrpA [Thermodesulfobacteriota bacterium]